MNVTFTDVTIIVHVCILVLEANGNAYRPYPSRARYIPLLISHLINVSLPRFRAYVEQIYIITLFLFDLI